MAASMSTRITRGLRSAASRERGRHRTIVRVAEWTIITGRDGASVAGTSAGRRSLAMGRLLGRANYLC